MLFQIVSDIHIEREEVLLNWRDVLTPSAPVLIIAGDVGNIQDIEKYTTFIRNICEEPMYTHVIIIVGNNDVYSTSYLYSNLLLQLQKFSYSIPKLTFLNNQFIDIGEYRLYGSILFSYIPEDFRVKILPIMTHENRYANDSWINREYFNNVYFIEENIVKAQEDNKKLIIITHYPPTFNNMRQKDNTSNERYYYYNNLDRLITSNNMCSWIFGHTHYNVDFVMNNVRLITNQYRSHNFNKNLTILL